MTPEEREQKRAWLLSIPVNRLRGYESYEERIRLWTETAYQSGTSADFGWCVEYRPWRKLDRVYGVGATLAQATDKAIAAAVDAMRGQMVEEAECSGTA